MLASIAFSAHQSPPCFWSDEPRRTERYSVPTVTSVKVNPRRCGKTNGCACRVTKRQSAHRADYQPEEARFRRNNVRVETEPRPRGSDRQCRDSNGSGRQSRDREGANLNRPDHRARHNKRPTGRNRPRRCVGNVSLNTRFGRTIRSQPSAAAGFPATPAAYRNTLRRASPACKLSSRSRKPSAEDYRQSR